MFGNVYVLLDDTGKEKYTKTYYSEDPIEFTDLNSKGRGVYCSVNTFEATEEQMKEKWVKTKRNIPFLKKINAVFADIDIAKKGDNQTREQKEEKKKTLLSELMKICEPSCVLDTSNGIQPLWIIGDYPIDEASQKRYIALINGIIERSKTVWGAGDAVKDVTRILRLPWYNHMKEEPYPITVKNYSDRDITIEEMEKAFASYIPQKAEFNREMPQREQRELQTSKQYQEVERLDFKEVIIRAFGAVGRSCEFDNQDRLIIDWRLTGNFIGKNGDRRYIASTSHEAFAGNMITSVWEIMQVSNKEAYKWILETFNIKTESEIKQQKPEVIRDDVWDKTEKIKIDHTRKTPFTRWLETVNKKFTLPDNELIVLIGHPWMGKTEWCFFLARQNIAKGNKVAFYSLELSKQAMLERTARRQAGVTRYDKQIQNYNLTQKQYADQYLAELQNTDWLDIIGIKKAPTIDELEKEINEQYAIGYRMFFIDNLGKIDIQGANEIDAFGSITSRLQTLMGQLNCPIILLHHCSKPQKYQQFIKPAWPSGFRWSQKILDNCTRMQEIWRLVDPDAATSDPEVTLFQYKHWPSGNVGRVEMLFDRWDYKQKENPF